MTKQWCSCNPLREAQEKAAKWDSLVRCGECKHFVSEWGICVRDAGWETFSKYGMSRAVDVKAGVTADGFCAWGIKREDDAPQSADRAGVASEAPTKASNG